MSILFPAFQTLRRDVRAGELTLIGLALLVAVLGLTSVGFVTDRVAKGLGREATRLMGADLIISADHPVPAAFESEMHRLGLKVTHTVQFSSMAMTEDATQLASVKALAAGAPLRGSLRIAAGRNQPGREAGKIPAQGEAWVDDQLLSALKLNVGDSLELGYLKLRVGAVVTWESDRGMGFSSFAPRILINIADLPASGLIVEGSRARYRLMAAGSPEIVRAFAAWANPRLKRGESLESLDNARPVLRDGLDRAAHYLRLTAMLAVVLAAVAAGLSARRFLVRHQTGAAVMRCMGASRRQLLALYGIEFTVFALLVSIAGCAGGYAVQMLLAKLVAGLLHVDLPPPGILPVVHGVAVGLILTIGFVLPHLLRLARVPPVRALRGEWESAGKGGFLFWILGMLMLAGLLWWLAGDATLGMWVIGGFVAALAIFALSALGLLTLAGRGRYFFSGWGIRYGLASLYRRRLGSTIQVVALALGLACIILLGLVSQDLLDGWRHQQDPDAPNRFVIGIQPQDEQAFSARMRSYGLPVELQPMIRGRLVAINGKPVSSRDFPEERARRLVEREFNLSQGATLPKGNSVVRGKWHGTSRAGEFSMEEGLGKTLGIRLGDQVEFNVAGQNVNGRIGSIRRLDWDSMNVNFFFIGAPGLLDHLPTSYITSFHLPADQQRTMRGVVAAFPSISVIDIDAVLAQVEKFAGQLAGMVRFVFVFALVAGVIVLLAAQQATHDERRREIAILRALGARNRQIRTALMAEFVILAVLSVALAYLAALGLGWALAHYVFAMNYTVRALPLLVAACMAIGVIVVCGWAGVRGVLNEPAVEGLREA